MQPKQARADLLDRRAHQLNQSAHRRPWPIDSDARQDDRDEAHHEGESE
jgi:hypothetical protein